MKDLSLVSFKKILINKSCKWEGISMAFFTEKKRPFIALLVLLIFCFVELIPAGAFAALMNVTPNEVAEQNDFYEEFELKQEENFSIRTELDGNISLDDDVENLKVSEEVYRRSSTVINRVYSDLKPKIDVSTTTISGQVLKGRKDNSADVEVEKDIKSGQDETEVTDEGKELVRIEIANLPYKTIYNVGEELDLKGIVIIGIYSDGTEKVLPITIDNISGFDSRKAATGKEVSVNYSGKSVSFDVDIVEIPEEEEPIEEIEFAGGSGTEEDPYQIATPEQLYQVRYFLDSHFELISDIDLKDYLTVTNEAYGWLPIGSEDEPFMGSFNGNGYVIKNLYINRSNMDYVGLFGCIQQGYISNLRLENVKVAGCTSVGGLVGGIALGVIENCTVTGEVYGSSGVGGLIGDNLILNTIIDSSTDVNVSGEEYVGGLAGTNIISVISGSNAAGMVEGTEIVGGLVGANINALVEDSFSRSQVLGHNVIGGLVGINLDAFATDSSIDGGKMAENSKSIVDDLMDKSTSSKMDDILTLINVRINQIVEEFSGKASFEDIKKDVRISDWKSIYEKELTSSLVRKAKDKDVSESSDDFSSLIISCHAEGDVRGNGNVGGLVGGNYRWIIDCYATGSVTGVGSAGGLVGTNFYTVENCHAMGNVTGVEDALLLGGLIGRNDGFLVNSYATGMVTGGAGVGGLVGINQYIVMGSYAKGDVEGDIYVGGLMGINSAFVQDCYAIGDVSGIENVGGLIGYNEAAVEYCYAVGKVSGEENIGGLVGFSEEFYAFGYVYKSYYDRESTGQRDTGKGEPKTTAEMQLRSTYEEWNFIEVWGIDEGKCYPMLRWQEGAFKSGFEAVTSDSRVLLPHSETQLIITNAMDEEGELLDGLHRVAVYSDIDEVNVFEGDVEFNSGGTTVMITLNNVGRHNLRIYVEGITYSNVVIVDVLQVAFEGGSGTIEDPYQIKTADQLNQVRYFPTANYVLIDDIDLGRAPYNEGEGWEPIGSFDKPFTGSFNGFSNGKAHVIRNLTISKEFYNNVGLFGVTLNADLRNITLENVNVTGQDIVGALVGYAEEGTIKSCWASGSVVGKTYVGGLVGFNYLTSVTDSFTDVDVTGEFCAGGLSGINLLSLISYSGSFGTVQGSGDSKFIGGLTGANTNGYIISSSSHSKVEGIRFVGGLAGTNRDELSGNSAGEVSQTRENKIENEITGISDHNVDEIVNSIINDKLTSANVEDSKTIGTILLPISLEDIEKGYSIFKSGGFDIEGSFSVEKLTLNQSEPVLVYFALIDSCNATGNVKGSICVGGLVGENSQLVEYCYSTGNVIGIGEDNALIGGLIGYNTGLGLISDSSAMGSVIGLKFVGGLVGGNEFGVISSNVECTVEGVNHVGGLIGRNEYIVRDSKAAGNVDGHKSVGGLLGSSVGNVVDCYSSANVYGIEIVGGLVGYNESSNISRSYASGTVQGEKYVGGLVGVNTYNIVESYAIGSVDGVESVGGLVGINDSWVENCYSTGNVSGYASVGGLIGSNYQGVWYCYAIGNVEKKDDNIKNIGGLVGLNSSSQILSSYYDKETTSQSDTGKGEPRSTAEMKLRSTYVDWDFVNVWSIDEGNQYPLLRWQEGVQQSGFEVETEHSWVLPDLKFNLEIKNAKGKDGVLLNGKYKVKVDSNIDGENVVNNTVDFENGEATVELILYNEGTHTLRVYVEGITYSNLATIKVIASCFASGTGKPEDPFVIENAAQLNEVRNFPTAHFILNSSIDLSEITVADKVYNDGKGWEPIGSENEPFKGSFDGKGNRIVNLNINRPDEDDIGLFGTIENAVLCNIVLENVNVSGQNNVGALVGSVMGGSVDNCQVINGSVQGALSIGGMIGSNYLGEITSSYAEVEVVGSKGPYLLYSMFVGGLAGYNEGGIIADSHAEGKVSGDFDVGGLVGVNTCDNNYDESAKGKIADSYAKGIVTGLFNIGGLVGRNTYGIIEESHAEGPVEGTSEVGGLVGNNKYGQITDSYAEGIVKGKENVGGLAGICENGTISSCYATGEVTGIDDSSNVGGLIGKCVDSAISDS